MEKQLRLIIKGKVQGVFYRQSAMKKANELGIKGYVKNLENGDVEILAQGDENKLRLFIEWCTKGPDGARVEDVTIEWTKIREKLSNFFINF